MITFNDAKAASRTIARNLNPISVVLFGSVAREGTGYDLDLLIVTDEDSSDAGDRYLLLHRCMKRHIRKTAIDPFIVPLSKWNRFYAEGSPFLELIAREGRPLYMRNAVKEWLKQAEDEFVMARYLIQGGYAKGACYHAQQSVEKAAKAKLLDKGWDLERIHSIERLVAIGRGYRVRFPLTEEDIIFIDAIHRGRYPAEAGLLPMGEPTTTDAQTAVSIAEKMIAYCSRGKGEEVIRKGNMSLPAKTVIRMIFLTVLLIFSGAAGVSAADIYHFNDNGGENYYTNIPGPGRAKVRLPLIGEKKNKMKWSPAASAYQKDAYEPVIASAGRHFAVDPNLIRAVIKAESNYNERAVSPKGALGLMQLMPATARDMNVTDPFDPVANIHGGVRYLSQLLWAFNGDFSLALAAYNAGPARVSSRSGIPHFPETRAYVGRVLNLYNNLKKRNEI